MKHTSLSIALALMLALIPLTGFAAEISREGSIQGFTCVTMGITCPVGKEDPMAAVEKVFVLLSDSNEYYFIPNVDRAALARHINERVRVTGELNPKFKAIQASRIDAMKKGNWEKTWGTLEQEEIAREIWKYI